MKLEGAASIVTGGASGLGEAAARALAAGGSKVTVWDLNAELGEAIAAEVNGRFCRVDVSKDEDIAKATLRSRESHGPARILVAAAGVPCGAKIVDRKHGMHPLDEFRRTIEINLIGSFNCARHFAADLLTADSLELGERGVVIFVSSGAAVEGQIGQVAYSASKAGLLGMTLPIARDLAPEGIRCVSILPGLFKTRMAESLSPARISRLIEMIEFPKGIGDPKWFGSLVAEVAKNPMLNGESIRLDGAVRLTR